ncbi:MAG: ABC-2 family transporter protein [Anaerolineales bacterium]|nr:ABC-2 family transporter protein [Anaerolineales bacterium]MCB8951692.1 ABC-2 family transporter protein [Ardenticatenales bacterium]
MKETKLTASPPRKAQASGPRRIWTEVTFVRHLIAVNLASAMEYRVSFITQILGMFLNNGIYFIFWLLFFDKFGTVRGYNIREIYLLFGMVALGHGLGAMFAGNIGSALAQTIAQGRLDYYLPLPRSLLTHVIFSRMTISAIGDVTFGLFAYLFTGRFHPVEMVLFLVSAVLAAGIFVSYGILAGSLAFFMGNAQQISMQATNAIITFALYPNTLFSGATRLLLYTLIPAAFVGAVPVTIVTERNGLLLLGLAAGVVFFGALATGVFYLGLRRYESGSAINVNL